MKHLRRAAKPAWLFICLLPLALLGQMLASRIHKIYVVNVGPPAVSEAFVRANIRSKEGQTLERSTMIDEDINNLYASGYFYKIRVDQTNTPDGLDLTYVLQGKPILSVITINGNKKFKTAKLRKKITSKIGQPLDLRKLFSDAQEIKKLYEKAGYQKTTVTVLPPAIDEQAGRGTVTFEIHETPKIKIKDIVFVGATHFDQKTLRHVLKTRRRWMFSWLTGSGVLKEDQFEDDKDKLLEFYQNEGYIDFAIQDVKYDYISPKWMIVRITVSEGRQYKVGTLNITGNHVFTTNDFINGMNIDKQLLKLQMTPGKIFKPTAFEADLQTLKDFYGSRGYLEPQSSGGGTTIITPNRTANAGNGTIDVSFTIEEGEKNYIERVDIKGNSKTKDRVIRRELAVFPGEVYDMVRIKISKERLEGLNYFEKVDTQPEDTEVVNHKNLIIGVEEKSTGNVTLGAGFNSVEGLVGMVEVKQGNFDLFNPPTFTGGGQKFDIQASVGTLYQNYEVNFTEPWFLGHKLALGVDLFHRYDIYDSLNGIYAETFDGGTLSLTRALTRFMSGTVSYTFEDAHVGINQGFSTNYTTNYLQEANGIFQGQDVIGPSVSPQIFQERGSYLISKFGLSLAYDTRNSVQLADRGQRTELITSVASPPGNTDFYKLELRSDWYFKGFASNHIWEIGMQGGVTDAYGNTPREPIFERWFLGGLYSLRGYRYHTVGPKDNLGEPLGGDTYYFGFAEYSIPIIKMLRVAAFYDIGDVFSQPYSFRRTYGQHTFFNDDAGVGLRIVLPIMGGMPLRLDYGIPIMHDPDTGKSGKFQIGVGYQRSF
jgi:outer membrane protein insertion porin family